MMFSLFGACLAFVVANSSQLPVSDRDVDAARAMKNMGLWSNGERGSLNHEVATGARATTLHLKEMADSLEGRLAAVKSNDEYSVLASVIAPIREWRSQYGALRRLTINRRWELERLGVDVGALLALQQDSIRRILAVDALTNGPFADVPATHWAFGAIEDLRKAGIVVGYLDGSFNGSGHSIAPNLYREAP